MGTGINEGGRGHDVLIPRHFNDLFDVGIILVGGAGALTLEVADGIVMEIPKPSGEFWLLAELVSETEVCYSFLQLVRFVS